MNAFLLLTVYCLLILLASLAGGWLPMLVKLTHRRMELAVSFVAGVMLGVAVLHMLPHAISMRLEATSVGVEGRASSEGLAHNLTSPIMLWLLAGFLAMFFVERFFCFHHHDAPQTNSGSSAAHQHDDHRAHISCDHDHAHDHHAFTWTGTAIGLTLHGLMDGVALAASVEAERRGTNPGMAIAGLGTFLVIFLHKPFDSLTLGTLVSLGPHSKGFRHLINVMFSLTVVVGVALFYVGLMQDARATTWLCAALSFSAGTFLCIAMSDLLPELQFHQHDRIALSTALITGLTVAWVTGWIEHRWLN